MGAQEWLLLGAVIMVPLVIAVIVTLWTLEQAIKRNKRNRPAKAVRRVTAAVTEPAAAPDAEAAPEQAPTPAEPTVTERAR